MFVKFESQTDCFVNDWEFTNKMQFKLKLKKYYISVSIFFIYLTINTFLFYSVNIKNFNKMTKLIFEFKIKSVFNN